MGGSLKRWWNQRYPDWVADIALRYLPVVDLVRREHEMGSFLEVGGNNFGLTRYLPVPVVCADIQFSNRRSPRVTPIRARGQALPFKNRSFEYTVSVDTLEHVPQPQRHRFLEELMRVTRRRVYLVGPMGRQSERQDKILNDYYRLKRGDPGFLDEHIECGLPALEAVIAQLEAIGKRQGRPVAIRSWPNLNLYVHRILVSLWIRTDWLSYVLHRLTILVVHIRRWLNFGSCYRRVVVVDFGELERDPQRGAYQQHRLGTEAEVYDADRI